MNGATLFGASEIAVAALAVGTMIFGLSLARRHPAAGWSSVAGACAWLLAEGAFRIQSSLIMPRLAGHEHESARLIVGMLGEAVYFGLGGIGILLLFLAAVADRAPNSDQRPEPVALAGKLAGQAWRYYSARNQRGRRG
ncbi:hypothetical protein GPX89_06930 [Nocardia sp. ET3-3]|uniref:Uncharacterized protein n=1 Tax=Nocardia terrae TaxID=2675851 RepID=A0A7K1US40_9NOCA|nr:hypothetical protein [Nocardia terrae]MVU76979.1 hypothetical protein [Nocardia terrae]